MANLRTKFLALSVLVIGTLWGNGAAAYCTNSRTWSGPVAVYVDDSGDNAVDLTGLRIDTFINYVKSAIQEINTASGGRLRLYYAGGVDAHTHGADGITLYTSSCTSTICGTSWIGCAYGTFPDIKIGFRPEACSDYTVTPGTGAEFQGVVAHELGHAIGLDHSDATCATSQDGTTRGIMRSWATARETFRWLRRDDIEGLRAKYGNRDNVISFRTSSDGKTWADEEQIAGVKTRSPIDATSAPASDDERHFIAFTDTSDRVVWKSGAWNTGTWGANKTVATGDIGKSWDAPAIAFGGGKMLVAWISGETATSYDVSVRWAVRSLDSDTFTVVNGPETTAKRVGASYDPVRNVFLVSYSDDGARVITVDAPSAWPIGNTDLGEIYHDVGSGVCKANGDCVLPIATSGINGPCHGWLHGSVNSSKVFVQSGKHLDCYYSYGITDLAYDMRSASAGAVGTFQQGVSTAYGYHIPNANFALNANHNVDDTSNFATDYFTAMVGSMTRDNTSVQFRTYYAR